MASLELHALKFSPAMWNFGVSNSPFCTTPILCCIHCECIAVKQESTWFIIFFLWKSKASSTLRSSRAVPHPSTNRALRRLTSEFGRDPVHSTRYGRWRQNTFWMFSYLAKNKIGTRVQRIRAGQQSTQHDFCEMHNHFGSRSDKNA